MDDLAIPHDGTELRPERISLPSWCCVRDCDRPTDTIESVLLEDVLLVYSLCPDHATLGMTDG